MTFKKISHGILVASLAFAASMPCTSRASAGPQILLSDDQTLILARMILGSAGIIIGASKIYANKEGKTKQQKRDTLAGAGFVAAGAITLAAAVYTRINSTKSSGLVTKPSKPLPPLPASAKAKHPWKAWFNTWLGKF